MTKSKSALEEAVRVGPKHQVTIPSRISKALRFKKGDHILMRLVGGRVEMVPVRFVPREQFWFWTREWQEKEQEAEEALARGEVKEFDSVEDLLEDLRS